MANLEMPLWPEDWEEGPGTLSAAPATPENVPPANGDKSGGILDGWQPADWSLADSGLHAVMDPDTMASIDLGSEGGSGGGPGSSGTITAHTVEAPELQIQALTPGDIDARLPDISASQGPDHRFYSASRGVVTDAGWENPQNHNQGYGYRVRVRGDDGLLFTYGHTDPDLAQVHVGDKVTTGQYLGSYGDPTDGRSSGPHTHFEVRDPSHPLQSDYDAYVKNSRAMGAIVNPTSYIDTVMPGGQISSMYGNRMMNGRPDFHPGIDLNRLPGKR